MICNASDHYSDYYPIFNLLFYPRSVPCYSDQRKLLSTIAQPRILWGPIPENDLTKFKKYASRVRSYSYQQVTDDVDISAYIHVLRDSGRLYIFPNLVDLIISSELEASKIMFLMSPCLRNFSMRGSSTCPVNYIVNSLRITAPNVSHLTLSITPHDMISCISTVSSLSRLQGIRFEHKGSGDIPNFDLTFLPTLSCKKTLRKFTLDGLHVFWSADSLNCGTVEFPLLESIDFGLCFLTSILPITELFRYTMVPSLKTLLFRLAPSPSKLIKSTEARSWHQFFDLLGKATTDHFKILQILGHSSYPAEKIREHWEHVCLTMSSFPNFHNLNLETFSITPPILYFLYRTDLQKIINSWPNLSKLELTSCLPSGVDFTTLIDIAVGLPHLKDLDIPFDLQKPLNFEGIPLLAHNLQHIHLGISVPLKVPDILVQSVDRIFPYLTTLEFYRGDHLESHDVSPLLLMMQNARRDALRRTTLGISGV